MEDAIGVCVGGWRLEEASFPTRTYPRGRTCREAGCDTHLSIYNDSEYCSLHHPLETVRTRGRPHPKAA